MQAVKIIANESGCGKLKGWRRAAYAFKSTFGDGRINGLAKMKFIVTKFSDKRGNERAELCYVLPGEAPKPVDLSILKMVGGEEAYPSRIVEDKDGRWFYASDEWHSYGGYGAYDTVHSVMFKVGDHLALAILYKDKIHTKEDIERVAQLIRMVGNYAGETNEGAKGNITKGIEENTNKISTFTDNIERYAKYLAEYTASANRKKALLDKYGIVKMPEEA